MYSENDKTNTTVRICILLLWTIFSSPLSKIHAQSIPVFEAGEQVCFVGDSITHSDHYLRLIRYFYQSRFPDQPITIKNCGISGDSLGSVLERFEMDIAAKNPSYAVVMMGMNDINRHLYAKDDDKTLANRARVIDTFQKRLAILCDKLQALPVKHIVLMSPSIYDEYTTNPKAKPAIKGLNEQGLASITAIVKTMAKSRGLGYVPIYEKTLEVTRKQQASDPNASLNSRDRIHPSLSGAYVMATTFLTAQQHSPIATHTVINYDTASLTTSQHTNMTSLKRMADQSLLGTWVLNRLPMLMDGSMQTADTDCLQALNQVWIQVTDLPEHSQWELLLNGKIAGEYTAKALAKGVDLASLKHSPWDQQTRARMRLSYQYSRITITQLRNPLAALKFLKINRNRWPQNHDTALPENDDAAMKQMLSESSRGYVAMLYQNALKFGNAESQAQTINQLKALQKQAYSQKPSVSIKFQLRPKQ